MASDNQNSQRDDFNGGVLLGAAPQVQGGDEQEDIAGSLVLLQIRYQMEIALQEMINDPRNADMRNQLIGAQQSLQGATSIGAMQAAIRTAQQTITVVSSQTGASGGSNFVAQRQLSINESYALSSISRDEAVDYYYRQFEADPDMRDMHLTRESIGVTIDAMNVAMPNTMRTSTTTEQHDVVATTAATIQDPDHQEDRRALQNVENAPVSRREQIRHLNAEMIERMQALAADVHATQAERDIANEAVEMARRGVVGTQEDVTGYNYSQDTLHALIAFDQARGDSTVNTQPLIDNLHTALQAEGNEFNRRLDDALAHATPDARRLLMQHYHGSEAEIRQAMKDLTEEKVEHAHDVVRGLVPATPEEREQASADIAMSGLHSSTFILQSMVNMNDAMQRANDLSIDMDPHMREQIQQNMHALADPNVSVADKVAILNNEANHLLPAEMLEQLSDDERHNMIANFVTMASEEPGGIAGVMQRMQHASPQEMEALAQSIMLPPGQTLSSMNEVDLASWMVARYQNPTQSKADTQHGLADAFGTDTLEDTLDHHTHLFAGTFSGRGIAHIEDEGLKAALTEIDTQAGLFGIGYMGHDELRDFFRAHGIVDQQGLVDLGRHLGMDHMMDDNTIDDHELGQLIAATAHGQTGGQGNGGPGGL